MRTRASVVLVGLLLGAVAVATTRAQTPRTQKPPLHGRHWMAVTGKPLAAAAGRAGLREGRQRRRRGLRDDRRHLPRCGTRSPGAARRRRSSTTRTRRRSIGINALGVAPTGATPEFFRAKGIDYPPDYGPLAAVTPGTPGGLLTMLAEYGTPEPRRRAGSPPSRWPTAIRSRRSSRTRSSARSSSSSSGRIRAAFFPHPGETHEAPEPGEIFRQPDLAATLRKLVEAEQQALAAGKSRREAIYAAQDRFYRGDIATELVRATCARRGGSSPRRTSPRWKVTLEEPVKTSYRGIDVYKLTVWTQGPAMLQALNILENFDLKAMGYNSAALHPHRLPGDEPRVRRPRLLLRRPLLAARGAGRRPALEGLREASARDDPIAERNDPTSAPATRTRSRAEATRSRPARALAAAGRAHGHRRHADRAGDA